MGDRATVVLYEQLPKQTIVNNSNADVYNYSPVIYTHWAGGRVEEIVQSVQQFYIERTEDRNMTPFLRQEVERTFPILVNAFAQAGAEPSVYNFRDMWKFKYVLPSANDMTIVADDRGLYLVNVETMFGVWSDYDWEKDKV